MERRLCLLWKAAETTTDIEIKLRANQITKKINQKLFGPRRTFLGHQDKTTYAVFSPDGKQILSSSDDKSIRLWDVATGKELRKFEGHESMTMCCLFTRDGKAHHQL